MPLKFLTYQASEDQSFFYTFSVKVLSNRDLFNVFRKGSKLSLLLKVKVKVKLKVKLKVKKVEASNAFGVGQVFRQSIAQYTQFCYFLGPLDHLICTIIVKLCTKLPKSNELLNQESLTIYREQYLRCVRKIASQCYSFL